MLLLTDWTDHDPEHIYATLKRHSDYYNFNKRTAGISSTMRATGLDNARGPAHVGIHAHESDGILPT